MTRHDTSDAEDREALKKEIKQELRQEALRRKAVSYGTCLALLLVAIMIPVIYVGSLVARSGLAQVPLLSDWLYEPSVPVRVVRPLVGSDSTAVFGQVAAGATYEPAVDELRVGMDEQQVTTVIREAMNDASAEGKLPFPVKDAQIAVTAEGMELFARIPRERRDATVLLRFTAAVERGKIRLDPTQLRLGALELPKSFASVVLGPAGSTVSEGISKGLRGLGTITRVDLEDGTLTVVIRRTQ